MLLSIRIGHGLKSAEHTAEEQNSTRVVFFSSSSHFSWFFSSSFTSSLVFHPVECSYCHSESMMGFRYRCQQCHNYQLCQDCFWRGHAGGSHSNQHQMKEYTSWVSDTRAVLKGGCESVVQDEEECLGCLWCRFLCCCDEEQSKR